MTDHTADPILVRQLGIDRMPSWFRAHRRLVLFGVAGAAALVVLLFVFLGGGDDAQYTTQTVERSSLTIVVSATGTLEPRNQVDVGAEISGRIVAVDVTFNDHVAENQPLARLDTEQLEARLAQSRASFDSANASVKQAEATLAETRAKRNRVADLAKRRTVSAQELDSAEATLARAEAGLDIAKAQAALSAAQVKSDETALSKAVIRSPIDGVVLDRKIEPGQTVVASLQTPVLFTLASDLSQMELHVDIDEADIGVVRTGEPATFTVDAFPQRRFQARLISVHNAPKTVQGVVTYEGVLSVENPDGLLRPGLTATADILVAEVKDALSVPNGALRFIPPEAVLKTAAPEPPAAQGEARGRVWVRDGAALSPRDLRLGQSDGRRTEVLEGDIAPGDEVVTDLAGAPVRTPT